MDSLLHHHQDKSGYGVLSSGHPSWLFLVLHFDLCDVFSFPENNSDIKRFILGDYCNYEYGDEI